MNENGETDEAADSVFECMKAADMLLEVHLGNAGLEMNDDAVVFDATMRIAEMIQRERMETRRIEELEDIAKSLAVLSLRSGLSSGPSPLEAIAMALGYSQ